MFSDHEIIQKYLGGDEKALELLVARYMNQIYRFVFTYVKNESQAQDITQDTFLKLWRNLKNVDKQKNVKSWIYTIAKNTALDFIKKKKAVPFSAFENAEGTNLLTESLRDASRSPMQLSQLQEHNDMFLAALNQLSENYKLVLSMYYYEYLNFREIAEKLQEPINTIKSRHRRGLVLLRAQIQNQV